MASTPTAIAADPLAAENAALVPNGGQFRVQKSAPKQSTRKPSIDPANFTRIDASQLNFVPPLQRPDSGYDTRPGTAPAHTASLPTQDPADGLPYVAAIPQAYVASLNGGFGLPVAYSLVPPGLPATVIRPNGILDAMSVSDTTTSSSLESTPASSAGPMMAPCGCVDMTSEEVTPPAPTPNATYSEIAQTNAGASGGSCCGPKSVPQGRPAGFHTPHGSISETIPHMAGPLNFPHPAYTVFFPQPTVYTYPAPYGSFMSPLQPAQWRETYTSMLSQAMKHESLPEGRGSGDTNGSHNGSENGSSKGISHLCTCGDGCQCVGCAAHPYNQATQDYVRSAWETLQSRHSRTTSYSDGIQEEPLALTPSLGAPEPNGMSGPRVGKTAANGVSHSNGHGAMPATAPTGLTGAEGSCCAPEKTSPDRMREPGPSQDGAEAASSPVQAPTPSDASVASEELSASDFFFVNYSFPACEGETASCPCGDDCQCIGCTIHNTPLNPAVFET